MRRNSSPFKWRHFEPSVILFCVRRYCRYQLSYRDLEGTMRERGLTADHTTVWRCVQRYAREMNKRMRPHLMMSGTSYRIDETCVKVSTEWEYLYRLSIRREILSNLCPPPNVTFPRQNAPPNNGMHPTRDTAAVIQPHLAGG